MTLSEEFEVFIDKKGFRHLRGTEFTPYWTRTRNGVSNRVPSRALWPNILPTLRVLDDFRHRFGAPVELLSTYRSPEYNRAVGGQSKSFHMQFRAIDFACGKGTPDQWADLLKRMRNTEGVFHGGIGVYPGKGFVHVDTRGYDANWRG